MAGSTYLNVFKGSYYRWRPSTFFSNIAHFFCTLKWAWQRATKGYCDRDLFDFDSFHTELLINGLTDFVKDLHGAPVEFFDHENDSIQPWVDYINEIRRHLYNSTGRSKEQKNEYADRFFNKKIQKNKRQWAYIKRQYFRREREIDEWQDNEFKKGMEMLVKVHRHLWD